MGCELVKLIRKAASLLPNMKFSSIRDDRIYFYLMKNLRISSSSRAFDELSIIHNNTELVLSDWFVNLTNLSNGASTSYHLWDFDGIKWKDISTEEDFFQKSLIADFGTLTFEDVQAIVKILTEVYLFTENDQDTQFEIYKHDRAKRHRRGFP